MSRLSFILIVWVIILMSGCGTIKVVSHQTPNTNLSDYETYNIIDNENFSANNMQEKDKLEAAILKEMDSLGYNFQETADLQVNYQIILGSATDIRQDQRFFPYRGNYYRYNTVDVSYYHEGILLIEIKENVSRRIIWQGSLDLKYNRRSKSKKSIQELIGLIFDTFPGNEEVIER